MLKIHVIAVLIAVFGVSFGEKDFWQPQKEYEYDVYSRTLTALPDVKDQFVGTVNRARLFLQVKSGQELVGRFENAQYAWFHDQLSASGDSYIRDDNLEYKRWPIDGKNFAAKIQDGFFTGIFVESSKWTIDEVNQLKAILSQIQVVAENGELGNFLKAFNPASATYKRSEPLVTGDCEVFYTVNQIADYLAPEYIVPKWAPYYEYEFHERGEPVFEFTKSQNFNKCQKRPQYHYGFDELSDNFQLESNSMGYFIDQSYSTRQYVVATPNAYNLQYAYANHRIAASPGVSDAQKSIVLAQISLSLNRTGDFTQNIPEFAKDSKNAGNLVYSTANDENTKEFFTRNSYRQSSEENQNENNDNQKNFQAGRKDNFVKRYASPSDNENNLEYPFYNDFHPYFVGFQGKGIQESQKFNVNAEVKRFCTEIGKNLQEFGTDETEEPLLKLQNVVELIKTMNYQEIVSVGKELYYSDEKKSAENQEETKAYAWYAFRDAVAEAGTPPAVLAAVKWLEDGNIRGYEAAEFVSTFQKSVKIPVPELAEKFFQLLKLEKIEKQQPELYSAILITLSEYLQTAGVDKRRSQSKFPYKQYNGDRYFERNRQFVEKRFIPFVAERFQKSLQEKNYVRTQLYIQTFANLAHEKIVTVLKDCVESTKYCTEFQRFSTIFAFKPLAARRPDFVRNILFKIYENPAENPKVRVAAVTVLISSSQVPADLMQRIAEHTHTERNEHVRSVVTSAIKTLSSTPEPFGGNVAAARSAVKFLSTRPIPAYFSQCNYKKYAEKQLNLAHKLHYCTLGGDDSVIPSSFLFFKDHFDAGLHNYEEYSVSFSSFKDFTDYFRIKNVNSAQNTESKIAEIAKKLSIQPDIAEELQGKFLYTFFGVKHFYGFDRQTLEYLKQQFFAYLQSAVQAKHFNMVKFYAKNTIEFGLPLATGYPYIFIYYQPGYFNLHGTFNAKAAQKFQVDSQLRIIHARENLSRAGFFTPYNEKLFIAGYNRNAQVQIPFKFRAEFDSTNKKFHAEFEPTSFTNAKEVNVLRFSNRPYTAIFDLGTLLSARKQNGYKPIESRPNAGFEKRYDIGGVGSVVKMQHQLEESYVKGFFDNFKEKTLPTLFSLPWQTESQDFYDFAVKFDKVNSFKFGGSYGRGYRNSEKKMPGEETEDESTKRLIEQQNKAAGDFVQPSVFGFDFYVKSTDEQVKYVFTLAHAQNSVEDQRRFFYVSSAQTKPEDKKYFCFTFNGNLPNTPALSYKNAFSYDEPAKIDGKFNYGQSCETGSSELRFRADAVQTEHFKNYLRQTPYAQQCEHDASNGYQQSIACLNATYHANLRDELQFELQLENFSPELKAFTERFTDYIRYFNFFSTNANYAPKKNAENLYEGQISLPYGREYFNATVKTPAAYYTTVWSPINSYAKTLFSFNSGLNLYQQVKRQFGKNSEICAVDHNEFYTFDNKSYAFKPDKCWQLFAQYTPKKSAYYNAENSFSLLIKASESDSSEKEMRLYVGQKSAPDHVVHIKSTTDSNNKFQVVYNNVAQQFSTKESFIANDDNAKRFYDQPAIRIYSLPGNELKIVVRDQMATVYFDGKTIRLHANGDFYKSAVRGLCGNYNGDAADDFTTPKNCIVSNERHFAAAWIYDSENCSPNYQKIKNEADNAKCSFVRYNPGKYFTDSKNSGYFNTDNAFATSSSSSEEQDVYSDNHNSCEVQSRSVYIQSGSQECFTRHPVAQCPSGCYTKQNFFEKQYADVFCLDRSDSLAEMFKKQLQNGINTDFSNKPSTKSLTIQTPTKCFSSDNNNN